MYLQWAHKKMCASWVISNEQLNSTVPNWKIAKSRLKVELKPFFIISACIRRICILIFVNGKEQSQPFLLPPADPSGISSVGIAQPTTKCACIQSNLISSIPHEMQLFKEIETGSPKIKCIVIIKYWMGLIRCTINAYWTRTQYSHMCSVHHLRCITHSVLAWIWWNWSKRVIVVASAFQTWILARKETNQRRKKIIIE